MTSKPLDAKTARNLLRYDIETGKIFWLARNGKEAGTIHSSGSGRIRINGSDYLAHRVAWLLSHGEWPGKEIDHINGNQLDNRLSNLRLATRSQNACNRGPNKTNKTGFKGVNFHKLTGKYLARIKINGKQINLGSYEKPEDAHAAYCKAAKELHGEFACTGRTPNETRLGDGDIERLLLRFDKAADHEMPPEPDDFEAAVILITELQSLRAASEWRTIESAPRDGSVVLAYDPGWYDVPHPMIFNKHGKWVMWFDETGPFNPSHWKPITPPDSTNTDILADMRGDKQHG